MHLSSRRVISLLAPSLPGAVVALSVGTAAHTFLLNLNKGKLNKGNRPSAQNSFMGISKSNLL